jgi:hypothetical protein
VIFEVSNDQSGKLVNAHHQLKDEKKYSSATVNHDDNINDHVGKLVISQNLLKEAIK